MPLNLKNALIKLHRIISTQLGLDPVLLIRSLRALPRYLRDFIAFRRTSHVLMRFSPCLQDRHEEGGSTKSEYFWQDLLVARAIHAAMPKKHVDIGSRVDGFVAHVASFREIEVFDVRPIKKRIPGVTFRQTDFMSSDSSRDGIRTSYCDSVSCLHALEHFGLGRYGDEVNPDGFRLGLENIAKLLEIGGTFYLSVPIGIERVEFNANWIFDPRTVLSLADNNGLSLLQFVIISSGHNVSEVIVSERVLSDLAAVPYTLGLFTFKKTRLVR